MDKWHIFQETKGYYSFFYNFWWFCFLKAHINTKNRKKNFKQNPDNSNTMLWSFYFVLLCFVFKCKILPKITSSFFKVWLITQNYLKGQFSASLLWITLTWSACHLSRVVKIPLYPMCFVWIEMACSWWLWPSWRLRSLAGTDFWFRADLLRLSQATRCFPCTNGTAQGQRGPVNVCLSPTMS